MSDIIRDFVADRYISVDTGEVVKSPVRCIEIVRTSDGREADLLADIELGASPAVVADSNTVDVMGARVAKALGADTIVLADPAGKSDLKADEVTADLLEEKARHATSLIAVGSGTLNDLAKYVAHRTSRPSAVFATAPSMNGYTTRTVSIDRGGVKLSLGASAPVACIFDLDVLAASPVRLIRAGIGDAICRGTAQIDWLFSHNFVRTPYFETPFDLQLVYEKPYLASAADAINGDVDAVAALVRILITGGLGALTVGSSHPGSMAEHGISHFIDMYADPHPGSLHGEQIGITTLTMARLQAFMLEKQGFDRLTALPVDVQGMASRYGDHAKGYEATLAARNARFHAFDDPLARLNSLWPTMRSALKGLAIPPDRIEATLKSAGAATRPDEIGLNSDFYREAVRRTFEIRDRYSVLDLSVQTGDIDAFIEQHVR